MAEDGKKIQGNMLIGQRAHRFKYHTMLLAIETARSELIHSFIYAVWLDQKRTKDSLFDIKSLRRSVSHLKPKCV